jgi:hypothetical protein
MEARLSTKPNIKNTKRTQFCWQQKENKVDIACEMNRNKPNRAAAADTTAVSCGAAGVRLDSTGPPAALGACQPDFIVTDGFQIPRGGGWGNGF